MTYLQPFTHENRYFFNLVYNTIWFEKANDPYINIWGNMLRGESGRYWCVDEGRLRIFAMDKITSTNPTVVLTSGVRGSARFSLVKRPCLVLAAVKRARPSLVFGPVRAGATVDLTARYRLLCGRLAQRAVTSLSAGRWPGQSGPNRHGIPFSRLVFVMLKSPPVMGFYYTPL